MQKTIVPSETCAGCGKEIPPRHASFIHENSIYCLNCNNQRLSLQRAANHGRTAGHAALDLPAFFGAILAGGALSLSGMGYLICALVSFVQACQAERYTDWQKAIASKIDRTTNEAFIAGLILLGFGYLVLMVRKIATRAK